jgi:hypothetical protein
MHKIFVIFGNNLNGISDSYNDTKVGAGEPKASFITMGISLSMNAACEAGTRRFWIISL